MVNKVMQFSPDISDIYSSTWHTRDKNTSRMLVWEREYGPVPLSESNYEVEHQL